MSCPASHAAWPVQVAAVRAALDRNAERLDEAMLSNCFAWMKKCADDKMDTMVSLLQKVLQLYAARALRGPETEVRHSIRTSMRCYVTRRRPYAVRHLLLILQATAPAQCAACPHSCLPIHLPHINCGDAAGGRGRR
jgi:hypothetical protein